MSAVAITPHLVDLPPWYTFVAADLAVEKVKNHFYSEKVMNIDRKEQTILSLTLRGVVVNNPASPEGLVPKDYGTYQIFETDDLVFKLIDLENVQTSRVGHVHRRGAMSPAYLRLRPRGGMKARFAYWQFTDLYNRRVFNQLGGGVRATISMNELLKLPILVPPLDVQHAVVRYLDHAELRIAKAIAGKNEVLARLREAKTAVISELVLGDVENLADTGVPGLGSVPDHWRRRRAKYVWRAVDIRSTTGTEERLTVSSARGIVPRSSTTVTMFEAASYIGHKVVEPGNLVINSLWSWATGLGVSKHHGIVSPVYGVYALIDDQCDVAYLDHLLRSNACQWQFQVRSKGIWKSRLSLTDEAFLDMMLVLPPLEEQREIARRIGERTSAIDAAMDAVNAEIALLKEYRTRLISDVVTGKIDVREEAAKLKDIDPAELAGVLAGGTAAIDEEEAADGDD